MSVARPRLRPAAVVVSALVAAALAPSLQTASAAGACARHDAGTATARALRLEIRCLINGERTARGLAPLRPNGALFAAAGRHARDMVRRRYFSHYSRSGSGPASRISGAGYLRNASNYTVGENIAWQTGRDARWVVGSWMRSPLHRKALLLPRFRELGIGVVKSSPHGGSGLTAVVDFGSRKLR